MLLILQIFIVLFLPIITIAFIFSFYKSYVRSLRKERKARIKKERKIALEGAFIRSISLFQNLKKLTNMEKYKMEFDFLETLVQSYYLAQDANSKNCIGFRFNNKVKKLARKMKDSNF